MDTNAQTVETYLQSLPDERREPLTQIRDLIKITVPQVKESMLYRMPTYEINGEMLYAIASQKHYMSFYTDVDIVEQYRDQLPKLNIGKSCIRFKKAEDLPLDLLRQVILDVVKKQTGGS